MSANTIRLFEQHRGLGEVGKLRRNAAQLRNYATRILREAEEKHASILARAQEIEESADVLEGK